MGVNAPAVVAFEPPTTHALRHPTVARQLSFDTEAPEHFGGTFKDSLRAPIHRWFRYPAGFSNSFVYELVSEFQIEPGSGAVLDPFAGAATTLVAARELGIASMGTEAHPLISQIGLAKLDWELAGP